MRYETIGRGLRILRHRRSLRQVDAARIGGISRSVLGELEQGKLEPHALGALVRAASAVGASVRVDLILPGGDVHRLLDANHAAIQAAWGEMLARAGWVIVPEATFNHYGERGSVDILAWHPSSGVVLVVEIKTMIVDLQDLLAGIDRKTRAARRIAAERGWSPSSVVPLLLVEEGSTARRRVVDHRALFSRFTLRGRAAVSWLRSPGTPIPSGLICFTEPSAAHRDGGVRQSRRRVRRPRAHAADAPR